MRPNQARKGEGGFGSSCRCWDRVAGSFATKTMHEGWRKVKSLEDRYPYHNFIASKSSVPSSYEQEFPTPTTKKGPFTGPKSSRTRSGYFEQSCQTMKRIVCRPQSFSFVSESPPLNLSWSHNLTTKECAFRPFAFWGNRLKAPTYSS